MCLATFAVNYNVCYSVSRDDDIIGIGEADEEDIDNDDIEHEKQSNMQPVITLKQMLGCMRKKNKKQYSEPEDTKLAQNLKNTTIQNYSCIICGLLSQILCKGMCW